MKKAVSASFTILCLLSTLSSMGVVFNIQPVRAIETIYIRADGSVDPPTTLLQRDGSYYTMTGNITSDGLDGIVVERSNIIIDGNGYTIRKNGSGNGFSLSSVSRVLITNTNIKGFSNGIVLFSSFYIILFENNIAECGFAGIQLDHSSNNTIFRNNIRAIGGAVVGYGIFLDDSSNFNQISTNEVMDSNVGVLLDDLSNHNMILENKIAENAYGVNPQGSSDFNRIEGNDITGNGNGIELGDMIWGSSDSNSVQANNLTSNDYGISLSNSSNSNIFGNNIIANDRGIVVSGGSSNNRVSHNNLIDNAPPMIIYTVVNETVVGTENIWDDGYPSGGNYWSDYEDTDQFSGQYQNETGSDGIGDAPYIIGEYKNVSNVDNYPLMRIAAIPELPPDTVPPALFILSPMNNTYYIGDVHLTFVSNEPISWMAYSLDGQANRIITGSMTIAGNAILSGLAEGSHSIIVYAKDTSGNTGASERVYFTAETQPHPFWTLWWLWVILTIIIVALAGVVYLKRRRPTTTPSLPSESVSS